MNQRIRHCILNHKAQTYAHQDEQRERKAPGNGKEEHHDGKEQVPQREQQAFALKRSQGRDDQRAEQCPDTYCRAQQTQSFRPGQHHRVVPDIAQTLTDLGDRRRARTAADDRLNLHQPQADDHGDKADAIQKKAPRRSDEGERNAGNRRPDDARHLEDGRVQRNGVRQVLARVDHFHDESLPRRGVERIGHAEQEGKDDDVPRLHPAQEDIGAQDERKRHHAGLRCDEQVAFGDPVHDQAGPQREKKDRHRAGETDDAQIKRRAGQLIHQPGLGDVLHPRPDQRQ